MQVSIDGSSEELREHLRTAKFPLTAELQQTLQQRVSTYVDELKALGWPPERVVVALKRIAHEAGLHPSAHVVLTDARITPQDGLLVEMVRWCIDRYYSR